jgi:hypothetical protein
MSAAIAEDGASPDFISSSAGIAICSSFVIV